MDEKSIHVLKKIRKEKNPKVKNALMKTEERNKEKQWNQNKNKNKN